MWVEITESWCRVLRAEEAETAWLRGYLSFETKGYKGRKGRTSLYDVHQKIYPAGLHPLVRENATRDGIKIEEMDKRAARVMRDPHADLEWLRPYQLEAVEACVQKKRGIVRAPTGSGKGDMIVGVYRALPGCWLFMVHRDNLVDQQAERFGRFGVPVQVISRRPIEHVKLIRGVNLATLQSMASAVRRNPDGVDKVLSALDGVVIDECHVAAADSYFGAIQRCPAEYRLGFSGTPLDRTDNRSLMAIACLGRVIYSISAKELIVAGVLAMPKITMVPVKQKPTQAASMDGFAGIYDELVAESVERNSRIVEIVRDSPKPCMVFVKLIQHGRMLAREIERAGMSCEFVWGTTKRDARTNAIRRLERRDTEVMVASVVLQEGVDIPSLESVVIGSGGRSVIATLQRIGRGMRTNNGAKTEFTVFDVLDIGSPMLERHSKRRMNTYVREGYQTVVRKDDGTLADYAPKLMTRRQRREAKGVR